MPALPQVVDIRDVVRLTLYPIEHPDETNGERYIASSAAFHPQAYADVLRKAFTDEKSLARIVKGNPGEGYLKDYQADPTVTTPVDSGKAKKLLGSWIGFEESVVDTAKSFVGLLEQKETANI